MKSKIQVEITDKTHWNMTAADRQALAHAQVKARRDASAERFMAELRANATPQTMRRLRRSTIDVWLQSGRLVAEQHRAAEEILRVWQQISVGLSARVANLLRNPGAPHGGPDWPAALAIAYRERYAPWRAEAERMLVRPGLPVCWLVFAAVIDNLGSDQLGRHYHLRRDGTAERYVQASLWRYAELAGWLDPAAVRGPDVAAATLARMRERLAASTRRRAD